MHNLECHASENAENAEYFVFLSNVRIVFAFCVCVYMRINAEASNIHQLDIRLPVTQRTIGLHLLARSCCTTGNYFFVALAISTVTLCEVKRNKVSVALPRYSHRNLLAYNRGVEARICAPGVRTFIYQIRTPSGNETYTVVSCHRSCVRLLVRVWWQVFGTATLG